MLSWCRGEFRKKRKKARTAVSGQLVQVDSWCKCEHTADSCRQLMQASSWCKQTHCASRPIVQAY
jgi:hypothetical protein